MSHPPVVWREVVHGRLHWAMAAWELERTDDHVVLHVPVGAPGMSRDGLRDGPRQGFLRTENALDTFSPITWRKLDLVAVHRFGDGWSTWRWRTESGTWTDGAYLNLERPWSRVSLGWDTEDLTLDVVSECGSTSFKDEHELAWAEEVGVYTAVEVEQIWAHGHDAFALAEQRGWPLDVDWGRWVPTSTALPELATGWDVV